MRRFALILLCGLWLLSYGSVEAMPSQTHIRHQRGLTLSPVAEDWVVFDFDNEEGTPRVVGTYLKTPPKNGVWVETGNYIYLGNEDPYCYVEVEYDTWWLQSKNMKEHCLTEFKKLGCMYISQTKISGSVGFLQVETVEDCLGLKGTRRMILMEKLGWHKLYYLRHSKGHVTIFGDVYAVIDGHKYVQISPHYIDYGLWYDGTGFHNAELHAGIRQWIQPHWLMIYSTTSLQSIIQDNIWLDSNDRTVTAIAPHYSQGSCNALLTTGAVINIMGDEYHTSATYNDENHVQVTCGPKLCKCAPVSKNMLYSLRPEKATLIDEREGVVESILNGIKGLFLSMLDKISSLLLGKGWETRLIAAGLSYYFTSQLTTSVGAGITVAILVLWNGFLNR